MGRIKSGILGGFSGEAGNVIGGNCRGVNYMRGLSTIKRGAAWHVYFVLNGNKTVMSTQKKRTNTTDPKAIDIVRDTKTSVDVFMAANQRLKINGDQHSLKTGDLSETLEEDFIPREKITHFHQEHNPQLIIYSHRAGVQLVPE